jgi:hypothetical protein
MGHFASAHLGYGQSGSGAESAPAIIQSYENCSVAALQGAVSQYEQL